MRRTSPGTDVVMILGMLAVLLVPAAVTLSAIDAPPMAGPEADPTPYGYTISLLLFLVPVVTIWVWHLTHRRHHFDHRALFASALVVTALGIVLNIVFGHSFFVFPDPGATLGIRLPAWSFYDMAWVPSYLPIEELAFYILGALFMIAVYLWADLNWLRDYEAVGFGEEARSRPRLVDLSPIMLIAFLVLLAAGYAYKKYGNHGYNQGFPGYFTFEVLLAFLPAFVFFRGVRDFINWRAFAFGYFMLLLISLVWEATLGVPYGWWDYRDEQMLGIRIDAWADLPLEAVLLWLAAAWGAVISYEFWRVYFHMARPPAEALFGEAPSERVASMGARAAPGRGVAERAPAPVIKGFATGNGGQRGQIAVVVDRFRQRVARALSWVTLAFGAMLLVFYLAGWRSAYISSFAMLSLCVALLAAPLSTLVGGRRRWLSIALIGLAVTSGVTAFVLALWG